MTHGQVEAMTLAQRVMVMNKGLLEQMGSPSEVYDKPASCFVASFIGSPAMNLFTGKISADGVKFKFNQSISELLVGSVYSGWGVR